MANPGYHANRERERASSLDWLIGRLEAFRSLSSIIDNAEVFCKLPLRFFRSDVLWKRLVSGLSRPARCK
jgi:hypothetical protein